MNRTATLLRKIAFAFSLIAAILIVSAFTLAYYITGEPESIPEARFHRVPISPEAGVAEEEIRSTLRVLTLNLGHGRMDGPNQILQPNASIASNLDFVAAVLKRENLDLVALQEADGPSIWSGNFDHVRYLAEKAGFSCSFRGEHVNGFKLAYGTAVLSRLSLANPRSVTFAPSPPTFPKGFVVCTVKWPGNPEIEIDAVSVHLDFSRNSVRLKQVDVIIAKLAPRKRPMIMMGDFNSRWTDKQSAVRKVAEQLDLKAYRPEDPSLATFKKLKRRLDWILISPELEFESYTVLSDVLSDHRGVFSSLKLQ